MHASISLLILAERSVMHANVCTLVDGNEANEKFFGVENNEENNEENSEKQANMSATAAVGHDIVDTRVAKAPKEYDGSKVK